MSATVTVERISKSFSKGHPAVDNLSLHIEGGHCVRPDPVKALCSDWWAAWKNRTMAG